MPANSSPVPSTRVPVSKRTRLALLALALAGLAGAAQAVAWTSVGSVGALEDTDVGEVNFSDGLAEIAFVAPDSTLSTLRYNIPALAGLKGNKSMLWNVRFRDTGTDARVRLFLRKYRLDGTTQSIDVFDSDAYSGAVGYQPQQRCFSTNWDFDDGAYYIQAQLTRSAAGGGAGLAILQLVPGDCPP